MGTVKIGQESQAGFAAGDGTIGTTEEALPAFPVMKHVVIRANGGNGNIIMVGHSQAAVANGFVLAAGERTPEIYVDDLSKIWIKGGAASQGYSWIAS